MRYKLTTQHKVVGEEGCPLADDQPPWKRGHVKLQLPKIHHGRGNIKKIISHLTRRRRKDVKFGSSMTAVEKEIEKPAQRKKIMSPPK
jgi:hypothetical protein